MSSVAVVIGALRVNHYSQYDAYLESAYTSFKLPPWKRQKMKNGRVASPESVVIQIMKLCNTKGCYY